jgi:hypothetical protein
MREPLTAAGYELTKQKLRSLVDRLAEIEARPAVHLKRLTAVRDGYRRMMGKLLRDLRLYEARHSLPETPSPVVAHSPV